MDEILSDRPNTSCSHTIASLPFKEKSSQLEHSSDDETSTTPSRRPDARGKRRNEDTSQLEHSSEDESSTVQSKRSEAKGKRRNRTYKQSFLIQYLEERREDAKEKKMRNEEQLRAREEIRTQLLRMEQTKIELLQKILERCK
jgi:hypothetical protein